MTPAQCEQLLYEEEGPTLDFKRAQYPFAKATDDEKSELLKDILGFANCWRRAEAFIMIGVEDVQGGRGIVHGISEHLQDHSLQQFVNNLTNRPLQFVYEACEIEGKQVGVIRIELQRRPVFLKRDFGKLKKGDVYVRRGSSTDPTKPADPDEIAHMGSGQTNDQKSASLCVEFADADRELCLGGHIPWQAEYCAMPNDDEIPILEKPRPNLWESLYLGPSHYGSPLEQFNSNYYKQLAFYTYIRRLARRIRLVVSNTGEAPAEDVRLEIVVPNNSGFGFFQPSALPTLPQRYVDYKRMLSSDTLAPTPRSSVHVYSTSHELKLSIDFGDLQPGRKIWSDVIYMVVLNSGDLSIVGSMFSSSLPRPQAFSLSINELINKTKMTVEELTKLEEPADDETW